jgi:dihydroorotase-like cyclic amidohydrolase
MDITGETLALFLSTSAEEMDRKGMGAKAKIQPPLRSESDRERLWEALRSGSLTLIGTDSLTYTAAFKQSHSFWEGRVGVNTQFADTLPLLWHAAVNERRLPLERLVAALSENAARRLAVFPKKGAIVPGADADVVVVDPTLECELGVARYRGGADYSLWEGRSVRGLPVMTFLRGELVMRDGEIVTERPTGRYIANT